MPGASSDLELGFGTADVYAVADRLGALPEDLPCFLFFTDPTSQREVLVVQIAAMLSADPAGVDEIRDAFTGVASALRAAAAVRVPNGLQQLEKEMIRRTNVGVTTLAGQRWRRARVASRTVFGALASTADLYHKIKGVT